MGLGTGTLGGTWFLGLERRRARGAARQERMPDFQAGSQALRAPWPTLALRRMRTLRQQDAGYRTWNATLHPASCTPFFAHRS